MSKKLMTVLAVSALAISASACSMYDNHTSPTNKAPGVYKTTTKSTDPNGTDVKTKQTTSVYRDTNGNKKAVVKTEKTTDPEGMFNKSTTTTVKSYN